MNEIDLAWLAGLLEGEGSFFMQRNTQPSGVYRYPFITVNMTDRDVIERVAEIFDSTVYEFKQIYGTSSKKQAYRTQINGSRAAELMRLLLPYMGVRRSEKICEILTEYDNSGRQPGKNRSRKGFS